MFRPVSLYVGLRYTRAKRRSHFISFISLVSMLGIAIGMTVLITVLSVMNGFDYQIKHHIFAMAQQVSVSTVDGKVANWPRLAKKIKQLPDVLASAPYVSGQGMLSNDGSARPTVVMGIDPKREASVSIMASKILPREGSFSALKPGSFGIVLGDELAGSLGVGLGDRLTMFIPQATVTPFGTLPRFRSFKIVGVFHVGGGYGFDKSVAYVNMRDAQKLFTMGNTVSGLRLRISNLYAAPKVSNELMRTLSSRYIVSNWTQQYGSFFKAIKMEKTMMFVILLLIIAVAAFNLVSTLVMVVNDKRAEIAILRTLGATPRNIMATFVVQGCVVGIVGTILGLIGGVLLALNVTEVVNFIEAVFHTQFISSSVYLIDYLPSRVQWSDVWHVCWIAFLMSLVATIYPAWHASRLQPAEALRYE